MSLLSGDSHVSLYGVARSKDCLSIMAKLRAKETVSCLAEYHGPSRAWEIRL